MFGVLATVKKAKNQWREMAERQKDELNIAQLLASARTKIAIKYCKNELNATYFGFKSYVNLGLHNSLTIINYYLDYLDLCKLYSVLYLYSTWIEILLTIIN